ncbi:RICIN domain-containing protein [Kitasatospora sp. NPDC059327]|uniref:RICIN domain-containing protein n=1 Tax=Kitasatospora sp. NPDC059327 TaxID=3346803 RepID=UPI0036B7E1D1
MSLVTALLSVGISVTPMASGTAHAAAILGNPCPASESMYCTRLFLKEGYTLSVDTQRTTLNQIRLARVHDGPNMAWRLTPNWDEGTFRIQNISLGTCLTARGFWDHAPVSLLSCGSSTWQDWIAHPTPTGFMFRNVGTSMCLAPYESKTSVGSATWLTGCDGKEEQSWKAPFGDEQPPVRGLREIAITYATKICQKYKDECSWDMESESPAEMLPESCESVAWRNDGPEDATHTFTVTNTNGWSHEIGTEIELGMETGALSSLVAKVSVKVKFSFKKVWSGSQAVGNQMSGKVRPGEYGWVTLSKAATKITGNWTFSRSHLPWTAKDTIAIPMMNDAKGQPSLYTVHSSPKPPVCT